MSDALSFDNENFNNLAFYSGLLLGKTVLMGPLTSVFRISRKVYANPEDTGFFAPGTQINTNDSVVERIRRAHQNDLENVVPFALIGLLYVSADPYPHRALTIFRVFAAARFLHTACYVLAVPQPARAMTYMVGVGATAAMGLFLFARFTFLK